MRVARLNDRINYQEQVEKVPLMFVEVVPLELGLLLRSAQLRNRFGLLVNDSLVAASALESNVATIASGDADFDRARGLTLFRPSDVK